jgi:hypothetical protein
MKDRWTLFAALLFLVLAVLTTHPLSTNAARLLPASADGLYFSWATSWVGHQLTTEPTAIFRGNILFPDEGALLYGEPVLGIGLLAWPLWALTGDAATTYNLTFVLTLTLSGLFAFLLAREVTGHAGASILAGEIFAFTTANYDSAARLQIVSGQYTPLLLFLLVRLWRRKRLRDGVGVGAAAIMQGASCSYYTLYLATLMVLTLPVLIWVLPPPRLRRVPWRGLLVGIALSAVALAPLYAAQHATLSGVPSLRGLHVGALPGTSYWNVLPTNWLYGDRLGSASPRYDDSYFFGFVTLLLAASGLALWAGSRERVVSAAPDTRRLLLFFLVWGVLAFLFACGRNVPIAGWEVPGPYAWFHASVFGYDLTRVPSRFVMFLRVCVALFAAVGAATLAARLGGQRAWKLSLWAGALLLLPLEHVSTPLDAWRLPRGERLPEVYRFLATLPPTATVLEYPQNPSRGRRWESVWLDLSTLHWRPIVNGFGANYPLLHYYVQDRLVGDFPDADSLRMLRELGVDYVVFHPDYGIYPETREARDRFAREWPRFEHSLPLVRRFDDRGRFDDILGRLGGESVYRILPARPPEVRIEADDWSRTAPEGWSCETLSETKPSDLAGCSAAIDGDRRTVFRTRRFQRRGDGIRIRFPGRIRVRGVSIPVGRHAHEYPRRLQVIGRANGDWHTLADWSDVDSAEFVRDVIGRPEDASLDYAFDPVELEALTLRIGPGPGHTLHEWVLPEVEVLAAD